MKPENFSGAYTPTNCRVSVIIKALNEEKRIGAAVESALRAVSVVGGEVVLADSCSSDRTVELAQAYPIRIVQLANADERRCGAGPQLGYQHSRGEFVYILDGDMVMQDDFLPQALDFMNTHPDVAGVGGHVVELNLTSLEYIARARPFFAHKQPGAVDRLDGGGLYRRSAINASGYFSDRNLHSYEEFDLAVRLRSLGWGLWRLPANAAHHVGHDAPPYRLLVRRWRTGYLFGLGELLRACAGQRRQRLVLQGLRELRLYVAVLTWWLVLLTIPLWPLPAVMRLGWFGGIVAIPFLLMVWRKRSVIKASYAMVSWCFNAAALIRGYLLPQRPATEPIASTVLKEPSAFSSFSKQDPRP